MRTKEEILENQKHGFNSGQKEAALNAMQQYADVFACEFAEWINNNDVYIKKTKSDLWRNVDTSIIVTTTELLEIFKK